MFRSEFFFRTAQELEKKILSRKARIFFPEFNIRLYDKNSESDYFFFLHQNQNIFFSNIGNQNIFLEKNHNLPLQVKWSFLTNSRFGDFVVRIYPIVLEIKDTTDTYSSASYLYLHLEIDSEGWLRTKLYDKRDDFNFPIVNFLFICRNFQQQLHMEYISLS